MPKKYYRVIKENFLWEVGAILANTRVFQGGSYGYEPIEDIWNKLSGEDVDDCLFLGTIENSPEYFERVYKSEGEKVVFKTAKQLKKVYDKFISE